MIKNKKLLIFALFVFAICMIMPIASANNDTIYVSCDGDDSGDGSISHPYYNITKALDEVGDDKNTIILKNGTYAQGKINITKSVTILGEGSSVLDGKYESIIFNVNNTNANVNLINLTFINAYSTSFGAAVVNNANLYVENSVFINNSARSAAAIDNSGNMVVKDCLFIANDAFGRDGGAVSNVANATIINSTFINNTAARNGGAVKGQGNRFSIINSTFIRNSALGNDNYGGAIYVWASKLEIINSTFRGNEGGYGGAIFIGGGNMVSTGLNVTKSTFESNKAIMGDDLEIEEGVANISYCKLLDDSCVLKTGQVDLNNNWWGTNSPGWDDIVTCPKPAVYGVLKIINDNNILKTALYWVNTTDVASQIPNLFGKIEINSTAEDVELNKEYVFDLCNMTVILDNEIQSFTIQSDVKTQITADDIEMYYHDGTRFEAYLKDESGNPLINQSVEISINDVAYNRTTDASGKASIAINLNSGKYDVKVTYNSQLEHYLSSNATAAITVLPTVNGSDVVKVFRNTTQYYATFRDTSGKYLENGSEVKFNINGVIYVRSVSQNGLAHLNINLNQGSYIITATNPVTGEMSSNNITVLPKITKNSDLVKYFRNDSQYYVQLIGDDGNPVGAGENVTFNINGVMYVRTTDENGFAKLNINLAPGKYVITAMYGGNMVSNNITVLPILNASDISMSYRDGTQFKATLLDGQGNQYSGQNVTFNVNGVFYDRLTDDDGLAKLNINLLPGKYIITSTYNNLNIANTITIN